MKQNKTKHTKFKSQLNTDNIDIHNKCIGIDTWVEGDSASILNTNRGLHSQVRHNGKEDVFKFANELARIQATAPEMLDALERIHSECLASDQHEFKENLIGLIAMVCEKAITKARGEK